MAIHLEHSSPSNAALNRLELEWMDFEPPPQPEPEHPAALAVDPASALGSVPLLAPAPTPEPPPAPPPPETPSPPSDWTQGLPPTAFGPPSPAAGSPPGPSALDDLGPPPVLAVAAPPAVAPAAVAPTGPTAPAVEIATLELTLADPLNQELIHHHGGALPVLDLENLNPVLKEQVDRYGANLTARLMQLAQAQAAVRDLYLNAMKQAAQDVGPGTMGAVFVPGTQGSRGDGVPDAWRFDPVVFTQAYAQGGLQADAPVQQRAFAAQYGPDALQAWEQYQGGDSDSVTRGYTLGGSFELKLQTQTDSEGSAAPGQMNWAIAYLESDSHGLHTVSLQTPAELHNARAVWFDATLGWVTPNENLVRKQSALDKIAPVVFIGVMTWATAGALGIAGGAGVASGAGIGASGGVVGAMTAGAAFGAISGFYSGLVFEGRIDLGGMFRGALTGAITAGVSEHFGLNDMGVTRGLNEQGQSIVTGINYAQRALAVTGQATLQGALQEISGGNFRDGFTAGLAQGLGAEIARGLELQINQLAGGDNPSIDAAQAGALRQFARVAQSAVSILANPDDPGHAFAMTFVNGLVGDVQQGLTAHGSQTVSPAWASAPDETAAETARLGRQNETLANPAPVLTPATGQAPQARSEHTAHDAALAQVNARWGLSTSANSGTGTDTDTDVESDAVASESDVGPETAPAETEFGPPDARIEIIGRPSARYAHEVAQAAGGELLGLFQRGMQAASGVLDALEITPLANVKTEIQAYLDARAEQGLSEAEIVVFGALYAATEALFPTNAVDFAGGIGKGIAAAGGAIKLGQGADELAQVVRAESRLASEQRALESLARWTEREPLYAPPGQAWVRKPGGVDAATQLEASLTRAGLPRPGEAYAPHHIVGFGEADETAQRVLTRFGVTPNEPANGVWLSREVHHGTYGDNYKRWVGRQLATATSAIEVRLILQNVTKIINSGATPWKP